MSAKVHLHMHVSDLAKSRDFYEKFLGGDPVKVKQAYVKFLPEWAPVNLALSTGGPIGAGTIDHVGVQVDSVETVTAQLTRVKAAGLPVREEMGVDCCHANQDKFWVKDPDGVEWEVYHLNYDLEGEAVGGTGAVEPGGSRCELVLRGALAAARRSGRAARRITRALQRPHGGRGGGARHHAGHGLGDQLLLPRSPRGADQSRHRLEPRLRVPRLHRRTARDGRRLQRRSAVRSTGTAGAP